MNQEYLDIEVIPMDYESYTSPGPTKPRWQMPVLILVLMVLAGAAALKFFYKPAYVSQEGRFKVTFFAEPHHETLPVSDSYFNTALNLTMEHTSTAFHCQVGYMDIPEASVQQYGAENIYNIVQRYVILPGSQASASAVVCDGIQGRQVTVVTPSDGTAICRFFIKGNRVYRCLIANKDGSKMSDPKVKEFLDSFHML